MALGWRRDGVEHLRRRAQMTDSKSSITYLPLPGDDPKQRRPDIAFHRLGEHLKAGAKAEGQKGMLSGLLPVGPQAVSG